MPLYLVKKSIECCVQKCVEKDTSVDRNSAIFFSNLATKLLDMTTAIQARMKELSEKVCEPSSGKGVLFASIETPQMNIGIKYEYVEYITRYGPPIKGKFDEAKLAIIRAELGISNEVI